MITPFKCQLDFSCVYLSATFYSSVCCCCNLIMFYNWCECAMSVFGPKKHSSTTVLTLEQKSCIVAIGSLRFLPRAFPVTSFTVYSKVQ